MQRRPAPVHRFFAGPNQGGNAALTAHNLVHVEANREVDTLDLLIDQC